MNYDFSEQVGHLLRKAYRAAILHSIADPAEVGSMQEPVELPGQDRKSTRLNSSHVVESRMPSSA